MGDQVQGIILTPKQLFKESTAWYSHGYFALVPFSLFLLYFSLLKQNCLSYLTRPLEKTQIQTAGVLNTIVS